MSSYTPKQEERSIQDLNRRILIDDNLEDYHRDKWEDWCFHFIFVYFNSFCMYLRFGIFANWGPCSVADIMLISGVLTAILICESEFIGRTIGLHKLRDNTPPGLLLQSEPNERRVICDKKGYIIIDNKIVDRVIDINKRVVYILCVLYGYSFLVYVRFNLMASSFSIADFVCCGGAPWLILSYERVRLTTTERYRLRTKMA